METCLLYKRSKQANQQAPPIPSHLFHKPHPPATLPDHPFVMTKLRRQPVSGSTLGEQEQRVFTHWALLPPYATLPVAAACSQVLLIAAQSRRSRRQQPGCALARCVPRLDGAYSTTAGQDPPLAALRRRLVRQQDWSWRMTPPPHPCLQRVGNRIPALGDSWQLPATRNLCARATQG